MPAAQKPKKPRPPKKRKLRAKVGVNNLRVPKKLDVSEGYLASQATGDPQNKLAAEATALKAQRDNLVALLAKGAKIDADKLANVAATTTAIADHDQATTDYALAAVKFDDPTFLKAVGVTQALTGVRGAFDVLAAPAGLAVLFGANPGEAELKLPRVPHAAAYVFEYRLEPAQPTDPWLPQGGILTKHPSTTVTGLAPNQEIRARVRAVGGSPGPWSAEVVGRAR